MRKQGEFLFRWRSFLPLALLPIITVALYDARYYHHIYQYISRDLYIVFCILLAFCGLFIRCLVIGFVPAGTSGRNTREQRASALNTKGIYSAVRHPLYLGNFIIFLAIVLTIPVWWLVIIFILLFYLYYERIMIAEESFLLEKYGENYRRWTRRTPAFIPSFSKWEKPELSFSTRNILKREYPGFFAIVVSFTTIVALFNFRDTGRLELSPGWLFFFFSGLAIYLLLRFLKKKTRLLHVPDR